MEQGEFDNLEGIGKPLNLTDASYDPYGLHMALKILKDNGFCPTGWNWARKLTPSGLN